MLNQKMLQQLNEQLKFEIGSAYLYLGMSAYATTENLDGFAHWLRIQVQEETVHAMLFYDYILERDAIVQLQTLEAPEANFSSMVDVFEKTLAHEQMITGRIYDLVDVAMELRDHSTNNFLQKFVAEQVEEEANARAVLDKLRLIGDDKNALLLLDKDLSTRILGPPPA